ncbi:MULTISPECIES: response regulator [Halobacteriovorax]|nr:MULTISPECIES: response regulator [Halobacteriovorax]AYF45650.1 putative chemotaxis protein Chey [Halobacteriovorax sp. BALOs_7]
MSYEDKKIFVIDDLNTLRETIVSHLREEGFGRIYQAIDGQDALKKLEELYGRDEKIDLIFSDINMPNMNGIELLKELKSDERFVDIPVVMLSSENEKEIVMEAVMSGASNYILKPFTKMTLRSKLGEIDKLLA